MLFLIISPVHPLRLRYLWCLYSEIFVRYVWWLVKQCCTLKYNCWHRRESCVSLGGLKMVTISLASMHALTGLNKEIGGRRVPWKNELEACWWNETPAQSSKPLFMNRLGSGKHPTMNRRVSGKRHEKTLSCKHLTMNRLVSCKHLVTKRLVTGKHLIMNRLVTGKHEFALQLCQAGKGIWWRNECLLRPSHRLIHNWSSFPPMFMSHASPHVIWPQGECKQIVYLYSDTRLFPLCQY